MGTIFSFLVDFGETNIENIFNKQRLKAFFFDEMLIFDGQCFLL